MPRMPRRFMLACGVSVLLPSLLAHNLLAQEGPSSEPRAEGGRRWHAGIAAEGGMERNPRFQNVNDTTEMVSHLRADLAGTTRLGRTMLRLTGEGTLARHAQLRDLDHAMYGGSLDAERAFTGRLTGHAGGMLRVTSSVEGSAREDGGESETPTAPVATPAAGLLPEAIATTRAANGALAYRLSPRTTMTASADASNTSYDEAELVGGWSTAGRVRVTRRTSSASSIGGTVEAQHATTNAQPQTVVTSVADWSTVVGRVALRASAGASALSMPGTSVVARPVGDMGAAWRVGRAGAMSLHAGRTVSPTAGIGRVLSTDQAGIQLDRTATAHLALHAAVEGAWSADPIDPALHLHATTASGALRFSLGNATHLELGAFLRERSANALAESVIDGASEHASESVVESGSALGTKAVLNHGFTFGVSRTLF